jgi:type IV pilus assembly protein PilP
MRKLLISVALLSVLLLCGHALSQEEKDTPSQKMKGALERLRKAPVAAGQAVEALKEAAKAKLQETLGTEPATKPEPDALTLPAKKAEPSGGLRYSPAGRRDPFEPLPLKVKAGRRPRENLTPLERYELGQLRLVGIVWDVKDPRAMVEDAAGLGYIVKVGTPIGPNDGKIRAIKPHEVIIEEGYVDFYGARKVRQVSMRLVTD